MNWDNKNYKKALILIPALAAFFITLIPTLKFQWPLSWDIIYHIQYAHLYSQYGLVLTNPLLNYPVGQKIAYPPLFHLLIAALGNLLNVDYFQIARFLQPVLAMSIVLSVSYVAQKFYGKIAGISAGFLIISSYMIYRIMLPLPENLALIFIPIAVYLYYRSIKDNTLKYALLSGILFILVIATHQAAILCLFLVITALTLVEVVVYRNIKVFKNYGAFLSCLVALILAAALFIWLSAPDLFYGILKGGISAATGYASQVNTNEPLSAYGYVKYFTPFILPFALIGGVLAVKRRSKKDIFVLVWLLVLFLLSKSYWFGVNVISFRLIVYMMMPLALLGGFGLSYVYEKLKDYKRVSSNSIRTGFLIAIFMFSMVSGVLTLENPNISTFGAKTDLGSVQIAPPSSSEVDLANWFNANADKNKSILISNLYVSMFLATQTGIPIHYGFEYFNNTTPKSSFEMNNIGYIVYDKRLTFPSENGTLYLQKADSELYPLMYYSEDIHSNINTIKPSFSKVVYENVDFIICQIQ
ncbi:ArnT family glycosyltransferase [Methanobacterium paludis]|uniref:Uncharacterized protein n=1 Tax=Methanobacterium paludis (strain DSM 25820 / JCM 18151 / SWAN1) TaxID=868131 RepID=F6D765_METPW|nr:glycosyltransferase family 39 protein [Methanobacterium paludis]AEG19024.1 hypothetical protein MSWAN_2015 [Methanobacterium paludis]